MALSPWPLNGEQHRCWDRDYAWKDHLCRADGRKLSELCANSEKLTPPNISMAGSCTDLGTQVVKASRSHELLAPHVACFDPKLHFNGGSVHKAVLQDTWRHGPRSQDRVSTTFWSAVSKSSNSDRRLGPKRDCFEKKPFVSNS